MVGGGSVERTARTANREVAANREMEKSGEVEDDIVESRSSKWEPTQMEQSAGEMGCTCDAKC